MLEGFQGNFKNRYLGENIKCEGCNQELDTQGHVVDSCSTMVHQERLVEPMAYFRTLIQNGIVCLMNFLFIGNCRFVNLQHTKTKDAFTQCV